MLESEVEALIKPSAELPRKATRQKDRQRSKPIREKSFALGLSFQLLYNNWVGVLMFHIPISFFSSCPATSGARII
jgi:hypothetical protein